jgi:hypothetical protein
LLGCILVSDTLNELDVVAVMFFVTFLLAVNGLVLPPMMCY